MAEPEVVPAVSVMVALPPCMVAGRLAVQVLPLTVQEVSVVSAAQGASQVAFDGELHDPLLQE